MTDEDPSFILGLVLDHNRETKQVTLNQTHAIDDLLASTNMADSYPASTPMKTITISAADSPQPGSSEWISMQKVPYRETIGSLIHISRHTRPDISLAVGICSRYTNNPGKAHWEAVKNILRYLKGTRHHTLNLCPSTLSHISTAIGSHVNSTEGPIKFFGYTDSDWAGDLDSAKSTSGYAFYLGGALISWQMKTQPITAPSSGYAELIAAYQATSEAIWTRNFLKHLAITDISDPTIIYCDNEGAIKNSKEHMVTPRNKSYSTKYHWVRDQYQQGEIQLEHISGQHNIADIFTKPLPASRFQSLRTQLGVLGANCVNAKARESKVKRQPSGLKHGEENSE